MIGTVNVAYLENNTVLRMINDDLAKYNCLLNDFELAYLCKYFRILYEINKIDILGIYREPQSPYGCSASNCVKPLTLLQINFSA